ncbi:MAG: portal protein, partial [Minisyncoccia bacterium]
MLKNPVTDDEAVEDETPEEESEEALKEIRDLYAVAEEYWSDNRKAALDDIKFAAGDHWPEEIVTQRAKDKRPCLTVDKLNQYVRQIVNDGRQNRPSIKVRPVDSGSDVETAGVFQGIIKHIEQRSNADAAYDCALGASATNGFGYFRILTEYAGDDTFDQELCIKRIRNPLSVMIVPGYQEADGSDMKGAFIIDTLAKKDFEREYPNKLPEDFETNDKYSDWYGDEVRIAEYWCVKEEARTLYLLENGLVISKAEYDMMADEGIDVEALVKESRNIPKKTVWRAKVSGAEFLEPLTEWPGKYIPLLIVPGNEIDVEGKVIFSGIIRPAKDAQRLYDYSRSAFAERVALT